MYYDRSSWSWSFRPMIFISRKNSKSPWCSWKPLIMVVGEVLLAEFPAINEISFPARGRKICFAGEAFCMFLYCESITSKPIFLSWKAHSLLDSHEKYINIPFPAQGQEIDLSFIPQPHLSDMKNFAL